MATETENTFPEPAPVQQEPTLQPAGLSDAVYTVLEGFTLPNDVRKILETAFYGPASTPHPAQQQEPVMWVTVEKGVCASTISANFRHIPDGQYQLYAGPLQNDVVAAIATLKTLGYVYDESKTCREGEQWVAPQPAQQERCYLCDCTGDVHSADGEWRGECPYCNPSEKDPCPHCRTVLGWLVSNEEGDDAFVNNASALAGRHYKGGDPIALGRVLGHIKSLPEERTDYAVHLNHCNIGECEGVSKYGDDDCPALVHDALKTKLSRKPAAWANPTDLQNFDMKVRTNGGPLHTVPLFLEASPAYLRRLTPEELRQVWYDDASVEGGTYVDKLRQVETRFIEKNFTQKSVED